MKRDKDKKIKKSKKHTMLRVVWRDAFSEVDEWHTNDSISKKDYICETVGFYVKNNKKPEYLTIASTISHDGFFCSVINIPKDMIILKEDI
jgi:hypothetical protein